MLQANQCNLTETGLLQKEFMYYYIFCFYYFALSFSGFRGEMYFALTLDAKLKRNLLRFLIIEIKTNKQ